MKNIVLFLSLCCIAIDGFSQVGINTTSPDAQLHIKSSNQAAPSNTDGVLIPKIDAFPATNPTAAQQGMMVYLTTISAGKAPGFYYWDNTGTPQWKGIGGNSGWELLGNAGTDDSINFIGTTDFAPLRFRVINENAGKIDGNGSGSVFFGFKSGQNDGLYNSNAAFGNLSLFTNTSGQENVAIGDTAMYFNQSGSNNMAVGRSTLKANTTGSANAAIGSYSLFSNLTGTSNTANGGFSLYSNITGNENTAIGKNAMYAGSAGNNNVAVGFESLKLTSTDNNTAIGYKSGINNTGANNIMIGANAAAPSATASNQLSIGNVIYGTTMSTTALGKIGIGEPAPAAKLQISSATPAAPLNTDGIIIPRVSALTAAGSMTAAQNGMMVFLTTPVSQAGFYYWDNPSTNWKGIGGNTGWSLSGNPSSNIDFIGTTSVADLFFKRNSINSGRISEHNTGFGFNCLNPLNAGLYNVAFGVNALSANTSGLNNTAYGDGALQKNTAGGENSAYGSDALRDNLLGSDNIANGFFALSDNKNASKNIAIGRYALRNQNFLNGGAAFDTNNIAIGIEALNTNNPTTTTNGINNTAVGNYSLNANTIGHKNVAVGNNALQENTQGVDNVGVGYLSLQNNTDGISNTSIGNYSLEYGNASNNTALGYYALNRIGGNNNTATGYFSLGAATMGAGNTAHGAYSLLNATGTYNTSIGFRAGDNIISGNYNISIGANSDVLNPAADYQMSIGNVMYGDAMANISTARFSIGDLPSVSQKFYTYSQQLTANGDGQSSIFGYRTRDSQNDGTGYGRSTTNRAVGGYNLWGDLYTFGVTGHCFNDFTRTGGVLGADVNGTYWSSLGYRSSGSVNYGIYATAALTTGAGRFSQPQKNSSIGGGFYGGMIGSWSKGNIIGQVSSGTMFASYNSGDEYTAGKQIELVDTGSQKTAAYAVTSTESIVYKKGKTTLMNGIARVDFDKNYSALLGEIPVVTTTPMGQCNGLFIESIDQNGFTIKELNNGTSNVGIFWIAVGDRIDVQQNKLPKAVLEKDFDKNINEVMFNENSKTETAKAMWFDGTNVQFGQLPSEFIEKNTAKKE